MAPQKRHYVFVKAALDKVKSHPSLGPKVTGRWITSNCLYGLVKIQLAHSPLHELTHIRFSRALIAHPLFNGTINRQNNLVGFYRLDVNRELFYWIGETPKFPRPPTPAWNKKVLEAEEHVLSNRHDASVAPSNTGVPAAEIDDEDESPDKRRRDDDVSGAQSNAGEAAEMDEGEDEDETPNKRLRYGAAVPPRVTPDRI
jgi:hypothetical protein